MTRMTREAGSRIRSAFPDVSRETLAGLETYALELARWQQTHNLIGRSTEDALIERHFVDSAQVQRCAPGAKRWLDIGSGAGFPGLVVAILIAKTEGARVHLVESNAKKSGFLRHVVRLTGAPVEIHTRCIEDVSPEDLGEIEVVTARAVAPVDRLLDYAAPFLKSGAICLFPKGITAEEEVVKASKRWTFDVKREKSVFKGGTILRIENPVRHKA